MALDPMKGMIAAYLASPKGKEALHNYLASPEGKKTICEYIATPGGKETVQQILPDILDALPLTPENRALITGSLKSRN
ncbi:MAG: hypothetical protein GYA23_09930 [Methanomicrobiales archaeon]|nr:hypothetical protein [Methanomicrobiales archaeon]